MSLAPGTRLGSYEVAALIGAGGMGQVYRAHDSKLDRDVALKILPESLAIDQDRLARFEREARTLASLNYPRIAQVYDAGQSGGLAYLAMELIDGEDLSAIVARGPIAPAETLALARQIAEALEAAHESGVIHRDLKPANIKVTPDGGVKVLDFGLAKALGPDAASGGDIMNSPTLTARETQLGLILGTAAYMAPEQAKGRLVDRRADVWAFGVVLYEMLTGRRAFAGEDVSDTLAAVLKDTPSLDALPAGVPAPIRRLLRRCLEKDRVRRLDSMAVARLEIDDALGAASEPAAPAAPVRSGISPVLAFGVAALMAAIAGGAVWALKPAPVVTNVPARFSYPLPGDQSFTRVGRRFVAISPDGTKLAYIADNQIYLRQMNELEAQPVRGTAVDPLDLAFSPDGESIAFFHGTGSVSSGPLSTVVLSRIAVGGGAPVLVCQAAVPFGLRWQGDRIVFADGRRILSVPATGGTPETLVTLPEGSPARLSQPQLLGDGGVVLYSLATGTNFSFSEIVAQALPDGERRVLVPAGTDGRALPSGHLVWIHDHTLFGQPFDSRTLQLSGGSVPLVENVRWTTFSGAGQYALSDTGTLVWAPGSSALSNDLVWVDRQGRIEPTGVQPQAYTYPRVSSDGSRIAVVTADGDADLWIWEIERRILTKLTSGPDVESYPVWTPDSRFVLFRSGPQAGQADVYRRRADGTGTLERLTDSPEAEAPQMVLADGRRLLIRNAQTDTSPIGSLHLMELTPGASAVPVFNGPAAPMTNAEVSPDGRWIAYQSPEGSTAGEVHVRPFPEVEAGRWQISSGGGTRPMWSRSARDLELFYVAQGVPQRLMRVPVEPARAGAFAHGTPEVLFSLGNFNVGALGRAFDTSADGRRFLMVRPLTSDSERNQRALMVQTYWTDELRVRVPVSR